jgi:hypothetical protein
VGELARGVDVKGVKTPTVGRSVILCGAGAAGTAPHSKLKPPTPPAETQKIRAAIAPDGLGRPQNKRPRSTSTKPNANARHWPPKNKPTALTRRARQPPANIKACPPSRTRPTGAPLASPTTRHASSTTRRTRHTTTTTPSAASNRQPSATPANDATTVPSDRHTQPSPRVAVPPKRDSFRQTATACCARAKHE